MRHPKEYYDFYSISQPVPKEKIDTAVREHNGFDIFKSLRRKHRWLHPRQEYMYLLFVFTDMKLKAIALESGKKDHSTVLNAVQRIRERCETEPEYRKRIIELESMIE